MRLQLPVIDNKYLAVNDIYSIILHTEIMGVRCIKCIPCYGLKIDLRKPENEDKTLYFL
jgi:hypothetical protein